MRVCRLEDVSIGRCVGSGCLLTVLSTTLEVECFQGTQCPLIQRVVKENLE